MGENLMKDRFCIDCGKEVSFYATRCKKCSCRVKISTRKGKNSPFWKGDKASYKTIHQRMNSHYGKANKCENKECFYKSTFYEWGNISGKYSRDRSDWMMLCHSCNQRMDYFRRHGNNCRSGHEYTIDNTRISKEGKRQCRICAREAHRKWVLIHQ